MSRRLWCSSLGSSRRNSLQTEYDGGEYQWDSCLYTCCIFSDRCGHASYVFVGHSTYEGGGEEVCKWLQ